MEWTGKYTMGEEYVQIAPHNVGCLILILVFFYIHLSIMKDAHGYQ